MSAADAQQHAANAEESASASEETRVQTQSMGVVRQLLESVEGAPSPAARSEEACSS